MAKEDTKQKGQIRMVRDQGGSAMVAIPPAYQDVLDLRMGDRALVELNVSGETPFLKVTKVVEG